MIDLYKLNLKLHAFVIFHHLLDSRFFRQLSDLLSITEKSPIEQVSCYSAFASLLMREGGNITDVVFGNAIDDENVYVLRRAQNAFIDSTMEDCLKNELLTLEEISRLTSINIKKAMLFHGYLPDWKTTRMDFVSQYKKRMESITQTGYGIFAKHHMFYSKEETILPVKLPDPIRLSELKGYETQRQSVIDNTLALLKGKPAANVLLYGDAGTGKSSTVKAIANEYCSVGLRLVEINKKQFGDIPVIVENLCSNPLKFILLLDDLSFEGDTDDFKYLKTVLEGSAAAKTQNIAIYATSNRRHLIKETFSDRSGDDIHQNETVQEMVSLSERFGLSVYFYSPDKERYQKIIRELSEMYGVKVTGDPLLLAAEQYALARGGRSPRIARQFIDHLLRLEE